MHNQNSITHIPESTEPNTKRILIVDPLESIRILYKSILLQPERTILTATCGEESITLLDSFQPDLIITAAKLADMNSDQLRRKITINTHKNSIPFLIISIQKWAQFDSASAADRLIETLVLPFRIKDLRNSTQRLLGAELLGAEQVGSRLRYPPAAPSVSSLRPNPTHKLSQCCADLAG